VQVVGAQVARQAVALGGGRALQAIQAKQVGGAQQVLGRRVGYPRQQGHFEDMLGVSACGSGSRSGSWGMCVDDSKRFGNRIGEQLAAQAYSVVVCQASVEKVQAIDQAGGQASDAKVPGGFNRSGRALAGAGGHLNAKGLRRPVGKLRIRH
jgi:hypothetical protein